MDLAPYVDQLRRELVLAAGTGGDEARALAERFAATLESAARLALLEALSAAADEITEDLAPGSVEGRLRGRDRGDDGGPDVHLEFQTRWLLMSEPEDPERAPSAARIGQFLGAKVTRACRGCR